MAAVTAAAKPATAPAQQASRLSMVAAIVFLVLLGILHVIEPEFDPSWRMVSEYEVGRHGWVMALAFLTLALCSVSLVVAIRPYVRTRGGHIGLALMLANAAGMVIAAIFTADPITASRDELTAHGNLHAVGALIGIPCIPLSATLVSLSLARHRDWSRSRHPLRWTTGLVCLGFAAFVLSVAVLLPRNGGQFGPDVPIGWVNRLVLLTQSVWLLTVARHAIRARGHGAGADPEGVEG